jgi:hypothetical protein
MSTHARLGGGALFFLGPHASSVLPGPGVSGQLGGRGRGRSLTDGAQNAILTGFGDHRAAGLLGRAR